MARITNTVTSQPMGRSRITSPTRDAIQDDGTALISIVQGEQIQVQITVGWLTDLSSATITAKVVEGENDGAGTVPTVVAVTTPDITTLALIDTTPNDNIFIFVIPETLVDTWEVQPAPDAPVYGFIGLEIDDGGVGAAKQVWKPLRGLVEVLYSPSEAV